MSVYNCFYNNSTCAAVQSAFPGSLSRCSGQILPHSLRSTGAPGTRLCLLQTPNVTSVFKGDQIHKVPLQMPESTDSLCCFAAVSQEGVALIKAAQALDNFGRVSRTRAFTGWDASPVCTWTGVMCSAQQSVTGVNFTQAAPPSQPVQPNMGHDIMLTGVLRMLSSDPGMCNTTRTATDVGHAVL